MKVRDCFAMALVAVCLLGGATACNDSDADEPTDGETSSTSPSPDDLSRDEALTAARDAVRAAWRVDVEADRTGRIDHAQFEATLGEPLLGERISEHRAIIADEIVAEGSYQIVSMAPIGVAPSLGEVRLRVCIDARQLRYIYAETGENALEGAPNPGFYRATDVVRQHGDHWTVDERLEEERGRSSC